MRLPNGYGSVTKLTGKRRKPWVVRVRGVKTWSDEKEDYYYDRVILGYYKTRQEALQALAEYNESPFQVRDGNITFGQVYELLKPDYENKSESTRASREVAFRYCAPLHGIKLRDIQASMLEAVIDNCQKTAATKKVIKSLMSSILKYGVKNNLVVKDYSQFIRIEESEPTYERTVFSRDEINKLWEHSDKWDIQILLMLLYSGLRVNELLKNYADNVDLDERYIYIPKELAKNNSSVRYVPIHDKVYPFFKEFKERAIEYEREKLMINPSGSIVAYNNFATRNLKKINELMEVPHRFHDTRHTFVSQAHTLRLDDLTIKKIVGHSPDGVTKKVYTHISLTEMRDEINKLHY